MNVLLLVPTALEARPLIRALKLHRQERGRYSRIENQKQVTLIVSGVGLSATEQCLQAVLTDDAPTLFISAGYCGAVNPGLKPGDVLVDARAAAEGFTSTGRIATVPAPVRTPGERAALQLLGVDAVEMEGDAVVRAARERKVPALRIRAVSDTPEDDLTRLIGNLNDLSGWAIARRLLHPGVWPLAWKLARQSRLAGARLAVFLGKMLFPE